MDTDATAAHQPPARRLRLKQGRGGRPYVAVPTAVRSGARICLPGTLMPVLDEKAADEEP
jgi:hypothetical protein